MWREKRGAMGSAFVYPGSDGRQRAYQSVSRAAEESTVRRRQSNLNDNVSR